MIRPAGVEKIKIGWQRRKAQPIQNGSAFFVSSAGATFATFLLARCKNDYTHILC